MNPSIPAMPTIRLSDFTSFEKNLSLTLIRMVYFLGLCGIALFATVSAFGAFGVMRYSVAGGIGTLLTAILGGSISVLIWRVICEVWMVIFGIYDRIGQVRELLAKERQATTQP
jgi:Ni,Fe-hydrogenase I cytochrome b subunit